MKRTWPWYVGLAIAMAIGSSGCTLRRADYAFQDQSLNRYQNMATEIEYPDVDTPSNPQAAGTMAPFMFPTGPNDPEPVYWDLSLEEAVQSSLQNSQVLRDLGGLVLQSGIGGSQVQVRTIQGPALVETDPRFGVDAALSAFDAQITGSAFFEKNDRALNNQFFGGGTRQLKQDLHSYLFQISKTSAYGTTYTARQTAGYDANNAPGNAFFSSWTTFLEAEARQPLLQGAGAQFNRIAGPGAIPGLYTGVLVARTNTDIALAEFELGVRNMVNDVEIAYWELYYAYRDLDTKIAARDRALNTWRIIKTWFDEDRRGGEQDKEAQAREQYYRLEEEVQNALTGRLEDRIRVTVFRGQGGVQQAERRLRLLMGVPISDGRLIRPDQDPRMAKVIFEWEDILEEGLMRREELRRQKWFVKRRELELLASRNFLYPKLDGIGRYRWRGFGRDLLNSSNGVGGSFDNAWGNLLTGDFQEWQLGVEMSMPVGFRKAHAAVRNAQLMLARERSVLDEQEREVAHDLSNAMAEMTRAYNVAQTNYNRRLAAKQQLEVLESNFQDADGNEIARLLDLLLDAQRRLAESEQKYFRSLVEYELAVKNVHFQKGSLLDYNDIYLTEGMWPNKAYRDGEKRFRSKGQPWDVTNYTLGRRPPVISQGPVGTPVGNAEDFVPEEFQDGQMPQNTLPEARKPERKMNLGSDFTPTRAFDPAPKGGFDHVPPGGIPPAQSLGGLGRAPTVEGDPTPVRLLPDASMDEPSLPVGRAATYNLRDDGEAKLGMPTQVIDDYDIESPNMSSIGDSPRGPVVRLVPSTDFESPASNAPSQAQIDDSPADAQPASYIPPAAASKKKAAKKSPPPGIRKF